MRQLAYARKLSRQGKKIEQIGINRSLEWTNESLSCFSLALQGGLERRLWVKIDHKTQASGFRKPALAVVAGVR